MIEINSEKCIKCGMCIKACPFTSLGIIDGKVARRPEKFCIVCTHCAGQCPQQAITFKGQPAALEEKAQVLGGGLSEDFAYQLKKHMLNRRSFRRFDGRPVDRALVEEAISIADWAPSAKNMHRIGYILIDDEKVISRITELVMDYCRQTGKFPEILAEYEEGNNVVIGQAKTLLLAYNREKFGSPAEDTAIALEMVELYLQARGIGTCWTGYLTKMANAIPEIREMLPPIPEGHNFYGAFMIGYPEGDRYEYIPARIRKAKIDWV